MSVVSGVRTRYTGAGGCCVRTEASERCCRRLCVLALHGEHQLVPVRRQRLLEVALAEVRRAEVAVRPTLAGDVSQGLGHAQVLLHVTDGLQRETQRKRHRYRTTSLRELLTVKVGTYVSLPASEIR